MDIIYTGICTLKVTNYPHSEWTKDYHVQNIKQASKGFFKQQPYFSFFISWAASFGIDLFKFWPLKRYFFLVEFGLFPIYLLALHLKEFEIKCLSETSTYLSFF